MTEYADQENFEEFYKLILKQLNELNLKEVSTPPLINKNFSTIRL